MFRSYLKTAIRNLRRNRAYSLINIAGLSIGLACTMLIMLYIKDELSYDRFHKKGNDLYRVVSERTSETDGSKSLNAYTGYFQGPRFAAGVPEIKAFVRYQADQTDIKMGNEIVSQEIFYTDSSFFEVFSFELVSGNPHTALLQPQSVVISTDMATKHFGKENPVGKHLMMKGEEGFVPYLVTAVAKKQPINSSIQFDVLTPIQVSKEEEARSSNWFNSFMNTFVVLQPGADPNKVAAKMQQVFETNAKEAIAEEREKFGVREKVTQMLQPFTAMHLSTTMHADNGLQGSSNPIFSYILSGIAIFILLIACINFINLTVARSVKRAKEIGIRKVVGGDRKQLIMQFLGESFVLSFLAFALALLLVKLTLPVFNDLSNKKLAMSYLADGWLISGYIGLFLLTGLMAGFYPAIVLSSYQPVKTLYSRFTLAGKNYLQKSLVVLQFGLASFLIIGTMVVYNQLNFMTNTNLGYDDKDMVVINNGRHTLAEQQTFRSALMADPKIITAAPKNGGGWYTVAKINGDKEESFAYETVDEEYLPMMKIPIVQGRNFSKSFSADSTQSVLVNEAFVKKAGWKNPIGEVVDFWYNNKKMTVVGVVKNHHFESLSMEIKPQLFRMSSGADYARMNIRIQPGSSKASLAHIEKVFKQFFPLNPYTYSFQSDKNRERYESEEKWKQIILLSALITVFISCIGLFGLSVLSAEKRVKEIGIRKVLGASVRQVVVILSGDFLRLVMISLLISIPLAWYSAGLWLQNYAYRAPLSWWIFVGGGAMVVVIAFITISFQSIRAAVSNPVKSLKVD